MADQKEIERMAFGTVLLCLSMSVAAADSLRFSPVSRSVVEARLGEYGGSNGEREATLKRLFVEAGCGEHLSEQPVRGSKAPNLICAYPGTSGKVIIVGAHFDYVPAGDGVVDNWSGASLLPSLYQAIKVEPRQHTYLFIAFTDEELGMVGSRFYAKQMTREQVAATDAMVNMDTLGLAPTKVWVSHADKQLTRAIGHIGSVLNAPVAGVNVDGVGSTDSESFARRKIPSITVHSLTQETYAAGILHSKKDKLSVMQLDSYYETYNLLATYLVFLDHYFDEPSEASSDTK
jgi:hypothetical protein